MIYFHSVVDVFSGLLIFTSIQSEYHLSECAVVKSMVISDLIIKISTYEWNRVTKSETDWIFLVF